MLFNNHIFRPRSVEYLSAYLSRLTRGRLWLKVLLAMFSGIVVGILLGPSVGLVTPKVSIAIGNWLALPGQLFLTLIQMIVIPLVFASVIRGLASTNDVNLLKTLGIRAVLFFVISTALAIVIGFFVATVIHPGSYIESDMLLSAKASTPAPVADHELAMPSVSELPSTLLTLLPNNPLSSMVEGQMLQIVLFAVIIGLALVMMPRQQAQPLLDLMASLQEVSMTVVRWAMRLAPYAVFGLMAQVATKIGFDALLGMGIYVITVLSGLLLLLISYLVFLYMVARVPPRRFLGDVREVLLLAFSTSSSAAVMPLTIKTIQDKLQVRPGIAQFVIPLGTTINMNGTALYQGVAAIFLAQVYGIDIGVSGLLLIIVTAVGASIGSPATPGVGIVILALVLDSVGIPTAGIALIMGVDRILDMSRTAVNVCGDIVASVSMNRWIGETSEQPSNTGGSRETAKEPLY
jgi:Na+/H+-dicarboxylate symporter